MSLIDILDKLEKLEIIENSDKWLDYRGVRNKLTHEYPNNTDDVIDGIKLAIIYFNDISIILKNINQYIKEKTLIKNN